MTPDQARAAVAALESKIASHETAISHLQDRLTAANRSVAIATNKITECVHAALRTAPEIRRLYSDLAIVTKSRATLYQIACNLPTAEIRPADIESSDEPDWDVVREWNAVVDRLMTDPDAELPS